MIPEIGNLSLITSFVLALLLALLPAFSTAKQPELKLSQAKGLILGQSTCIILSYICLTYSFLSNNFTVAYVANNSSLALPWYYKLCAVWGGHEGSMLLWATLLSLWSLAVSQSKQAIAPKTKTKILVVLGWIALGFLSFLIVTSNPFNRIFYNVPTEGMDLNPLLQDFGFLLHPPMLYMGYVGFAISFGFAIASLWEGRLDKNWALSMRPWALSAWCFLTLGITLGSWWAYRELGWGGWWFWDPVENASFMPWLIGTALIHSLTVTEKQNQLKAWTVFLAIAAFSLSLLGTFLVRSGVLTSVHAFAIDPKRGIFMLLFLFTVVSFSLLLYGVRANQLQSKYGFSLLSKESALLLNNTLLCVAMLTILMGTLYPLIIDALDLGKLSVGAPYFNSVFVPLCLPFLLLMGIGPMAHWNRMPYSLLYERLKLSALLSFLIAILLPLAFFHKLSMALSLGLGLASWIIITTILNLMHRKKINKSKVSLRYYGMVVAHLGVACCVVGVSMVTQMSVERDLRIAKGDSINIPPYQLKLLNYQAIEGINFKGTQANFLLTKDNKPINTIRPQKRIYNIQKMPMSDASIDANLWRDIYIALGEPLSESEWSVRVYVKPFIRWIWGGGLLMLIGGILAFSEKKKAILNPTINPEHAPRAPI